MTTATSWLPSQMRTVAPPPDALCAERAAHPRLVANPCPGKPQRRGTSFQLPERFIELITDGVDKIKCEGCGTLALADSHRSCFVKRHSSC
eukprot:1343180-Amphidinium_carterae.1